MTIDYNHNKEVKMIRGFAMLALQAMNLFFVFFTPNQSIGRVLLFGSFLLMGLLISGAVLCLSIWAIFN